MNWSISVVCAPLNERLNTGNIPIWSLRPFHLRKMLLPTNKTPPYAGGDMASALR